MSDTGNKVGIVCGTSPIMTRTWSRLFAFILVDLYPVYRDILSPVTVEASTVVGNDEFTSGYGQIGTGEFSG